jgi:hypothetical protein
MVGFIANPRRSPRTPARCRARVVSAAATFEAATEDLGHHGCQVIAPRLVREGEPLRLTLSDARVSEPLAVAGRVAWASAHAPWRLGIAFDDAAVRASARFVSELLEAYPSLTPAARFPDRIPLDTVVYLATPPRLVVDFTRDEVDLLRAVASGARIDELLARFRDRWPRIQTALYSLLARNHLALTRGAAVLPDAWRRILADLEGVLAAAELEDAQAPTPPPGWGRALTPPPASSWTPAPAPGPAAAAVAASKPVAPTAPAAEPWPWTAALEPIATAAEPPPPEPAGRRRGSEAQAYFDRALAEAGCGHTAAAVALLQRALALAPGDPEIADALGQVAFTGRRPAR